VLRRDSMNKFWLLSLIIVAIIAGCSSDDMPPELSKDRMHLINALFAFDEANEMSQLPEGATGYRPQPGANEKIEALLAKGLKEGDSISDEFLDWLHPEMRMFFRGKYMRGHRLVFEGRKEDSVTKQVTGIELIEEWYYYFWEKNVDSIYKKVYPKG
jgi:hypothetical protein